mgnify:CR=1 FL=1
MLSHGSGGYVPEVFLSASASPDGWPEKGRHIGGQKAEYMPRHQKRIKTTILAHTTTLNLLHDSVHWFIVTIDTTTMTITFQNSAGTYGQHAWKPLLLRWLRQYTPGPWQAVQGTSPRQPRGTECGTHTLLINMIAYTTNKPHPDTSDPQSSGESQHAD